MAAAAALGVGAVGGVVGFAAAGTAGASTLNKIAAATHTKVTKTGSNEKAGNLTLTLINTTATAIATSVLTLTLKVGKSGTVDWYSAPAVTGHGLTASAATVTGVKATIKVSEAAKTTATITVTTVRYKTTTAVGTITVTPTWKTAALTTSEGTFTPASATNAYATTTTPPAMVTPTLKATTSPNLKQTGTGQAAATWKLTFTGTKGKGWDKTQTISVAVLTNATTNCTGATKGYILFTGAPTAKATTTTNVSATPTFTVATSATGTHCSAVSHNQVTLTFTNSGTFTNTTASKNKLTITLSGVKYNTHKAVTGQVAVKATGATTAATPTKTAGPTGASNATIASVVVTANTPATSVPGGALGAPISPIKLIENTAGTVKAGYVCINLTPAANTFDAAKTATAKVATGTGTVTSKVFYESTAGAKVTSGKAKFAVFQVKTASTATASTYTVTGLSVNAEVTKGATVMAVVGEATAATNCTATTAIGKAVAFSTATSSTQVYGATADATAAAIFTRAFPHTGAAGTCPSTHAAVVATTKVYQDALSSQYLASDLKTGTLLTPTTSLSQATKTMLRREGITTVYIVGGPLAVTATVASAIAALPVYKCGGTTVTKTAGTITVQRLYGQTQYGTAKAVAEFVGSAPAKSFAGAYVTPTATPNSTGGTGMFNDTAGKGTKAPLVPSEPTAILASGQEFQDAQSASVVAYATGIPMLLTPATTLSTTAVAAINDLHVKQVILMGGQLAVTNTVEAALVAKTGVSVLRVSGKDYTDTARLLANFECTTTNGLGWTPGHRVMVARGNGFTDGLVGAVLENAANATTGAAGTKRPLLLTESPTVVGTYLTTFLKIAGKTGIDTTAGKKVTSLTILGGPLAVSPAVVSEMQTDLKS